MNAEFQRAEETILKDVLAPSDLISAGYTTYSILTKSDQVFSGLLASESPTSLTLRQAEGKQETVLRKDVEELRAMSVSMMPEDMFNTVGPKDLADLLSWLRHLRLVARHGGLYTHRHRSNRDGKFCIIRSY